MDHRHIRALRSLFSTPLSSIFRAAPSHQYSRLNSAGGNDPSVFYHDYHRALRSPRAVPDTFGNDEALPRVESYRPPFEIDQKLTLNDVEKLVVLFVLVPMVFTTKNPQPHDCAIHLAERLVVPLKFAVIGKPLFFHDFQRLIVNIQTSFIRIRPCIAHSNPPNLRTWMIYLNENLIHIPSPNELPRLLE